VDQYYFYNDVEFYLYFKITALKYLRVVKNQIFILLFKITLVNSALGKEILLLLLSSIEFIFETTD
jgi:hypothetical protein